MLSLSWLSRQALSRLTRCELAALARAESTVVTVAVTVTVTATLAAIALAELTLLGKVRSVVLSLADGVAATESDSNGEHTAGDGRSDVHTAS